MLSYVPESYNSGMVTEFKRKQDFKKGQDRKQRSFFSTFFPLIYSCLDFSLYFEYKLGENGKVITWTVVLRLAVKK